MLKDDTTCEVTRCEECPFWSEVEGAWEHCSRGADPEKRYPVYNSGEEKQDIPDDCPLKIENVTVTLVVQTTKE